MTNHDDSAEKALRGYAGRASGYAAEDDAARYLRSRGYTLRARNVKSKQGEIDIIADKGEFICFIEVKRRTKSDFGTALEAVTTAKQRKLSRAAMVWLQQNAAAMRNRQPRFDVLAIDTDDSGTHYTLIENAFEPLL